MAKREIKKQDKLKILAAGDLHGDIGIAEKLSEKARICKLSLVVQQQVMCAEACTSVSPNFM